MATHTPRPANISGKVKTSRMRTASLAIAASMIAVVMSAHAEEPNVLPPVTVLPAPPPKGATSPGPAQTGPGQTAPGPASAGHPGCGAAAAGANPSFDCLNETLKRQVDQVNPVLNTPPISAGSQDLKVGTVNIPAVQQQYGQNFGHSVIPYRPPPLTFTSPLGRH